MRNLLIFPATLLTVHGQIDGGECTYAVELLQLQDGSWSFQSHIESMAKFMGELVETLHDRYGEFKYGVSSFVDKPIPYSGYGSFGGWQGWVQDYCYRHHTPLNGDVSTIVDGLNDLVSNLGSGNDFPENPLEALMYAASDAEVAWTDHSVTHSPGGRPIVRIAMVITDDIPHSPNDAYLNTQLGWNWPRSYPNGPSGLSTGGFGAHTFVTSQQIDYSGDSEADYYEMADLFAIYDNKGALTADQEARLDKLVTRFGPYPWPKIEAVHPGDLSMDCSETEYPTAKQVGDFLRPLNILPIFLVARPTAVARPLQNACTALGFDPQTETTDCLVEYYKQNATQMNLPAVVAAIDGDNTLDVIIDAVGALTDLLCLTPTTTSTSLITTTEPVQATTTADPTSATADPDTTSTEVEINHTTSHGQVTTTPDPEVSEGGNTSPSAEVSSPPAEVSSPPAEVSSPPAEASSPFVTGAETVSPSSATASIPSTSEEVSGTTTEDDDIDVVVPPVDPPQPPPATGGEEGPNVGVIAGATGGAVAGVAALAGIAYAKFGGGLFGSSAPAGMEGIQQVETPDSPIERETMEEVTMDMFQ